VFWGVFQLFLGNFGIGPLCFWDHRGEQGKFSKNLFRRQMCLGMFLRYFGAYFNCFWITLELGHCVFGPQGGPRRNFQKFFLAPNVFRSVSMVFWGMFETFLGNFGIRSLWFWDHRGSKTKISKNCFGAKCVSKAQRPKVFWGTLRALLSNFDIKAAMFLRQPG
jgi:hypothetical protein